MKYFMNMKQSPAPLLLLPGLLCDATIWAPQQDVFAEVGVTVADYGDANRLEEMARRALARAPARVSLAGHSMGARVALEVLRIAPERVERLALLSTGMHPVRPGEAEKRHGLLDLGRAQGVDALIDAWLPPMVHESRRSDPEIMAPLRDMCRRAGLATYAAQIAALLARPDPTDLLGRIAVPTLVATGRQDGWSPVDQHVEIASAIPGSTFLVFEESGHMAPFEVPDQVNAALRRWLEQPALEEVFR